MKYYNDKTVDNSAIEIKPELSSSDLIYLGLNEIAYIKPIVEDGEDIFGIFAADGERIGFAPEFELACALTIRKDLYPVNVH